MVKQNIITKQVLHICTKKYKVEIDGIMNDIKLACKELPLRKLIAIKEFK